MVRNAEWVMLYTHISQFVLKGFGSICDLGRKCGFPLTFGTLVILGCQHGDMFYSFVIFCFLFFSPMWQTALFFSAPWIVALFFQLNFPAKFHIFIIIFFFTTDRVFKPKPCTLQRLCGGSLSWVVVSDTALAPRSQRITDQRPFGIRFSLRALASASRG